jgi:hypothetical protein
MVRDIVYFDLETDRTPNDAGSWDRKGNMQMSIGVVFSNRTGRYEVFSEARVHELIERLRRADLVVGFNALPSQTLIWKQIPVSKASHVPSIPETLTYEVPLAK